MLQRLAYWLIPFIAGSVALFIVIFLVQINSEIEIDKSHTGDKLELSSQMSKEKPSVWLDNLSKSERLSYSYPVDEIYLDIDLTKEIVDVETYKLTALLKDPYQLFCIKQELKKMNLQYSLKKDKKGLELLIVSKKLSQLKVLVKSLKNYQINANVLLYKKESK